MKFAFSTLSASLGIAVCIASGVALLSGDAKDVTLTFFSFILGLMLAVNSGIVVGGEWDK